MLKKLHDFVLPVILVNILASKIENIKIFAHSMLWTLITGWQTRLTQAGGTVQ